MLSMRYSQCISNIFDTDDGFGANSTYLGVLLIIFWWDVKFKVVGRVRSEFTLTCILEFLSMVTRPRFTTITTIPSATSFTFLSSLWYFVSYMRIDPCLGAFTIADGLLQGEPRRPRLQ